MRLRALLLLVTLLCGARAARAQDTTGTGPPPAAMLGLDSLLGITVSTGARYSQDVSEVASSVTIVTAEDIARYGYRTLDEVLAATPGFYTSNDRNYTYIGTRGFSRPTDYNNRVLLLVDGNAVNEGVWGGAPMGGDLAFSLRGLERIEIIRGPGSALYGTGAMFGVVNLITRTTATLEGGEVGVHGGGEGRRGADVLYGHRFPDGTGLTVGAAWERADGADRFYKEYDDPTSNNGVANNLDWERRLGVHSSVSRGNIRLHGRYSARRKGIPTGAYEMAFNSPEAASLDAYAALELDYDAELTPDKHLSTRAYFNRYRYEGDYPTVTDSLGGITNVTEGGRNTVLGAEATLQWDLGSGNRLTVGSELRRTLEASYYLPRQGPRDLDLDQPSTRVSAYAQDEFHLNRRLTLLAGLRFDGYSQSQDAVSPRLAAILRPGRRATVKLLYGSAFRAPNVYEQGAVSADYLPNPKLAPERVHTLELVWQQPLRRGVLWTASLFRYQMRGLIDLVAVDTAAGAYQYRNVGDATSNGLEAGVEARLGRSVTGFANYTYQRTVDDATAVRLSNSPAHLLKGGISAAASPGARAALTARYESSRRTVYDTDTRPYLLADLQLGFGIVTAPDDRSIEFGIRITNLFDTRYASPGGVEHRQAAVAQDGRMVMAELRYGF